jgi:hypothetical protein
MGTVPVNHRSPFGTNRNATETVKRMFSQALQGIRDGRYPLPVNQHTNYDAGSPAGRSTNV